MFGVFRRPSPPPATVAMVAVGGGVFSWYLNLALGCSCVGHKPLMLIVVISLVEIVYRVFPAISATTGHLGHGGRWWWPLMMSIVAAHVVYLLIKNPIKLLMLNYK